MRPTVHYMGAEITLSEDGNAFVMADDRKDVAVHLSEDVEAQLRLLCELQRLLSEVPDPGASDEEKR